MSRDVVRGLRLLILPTLALVAVALFLPGRLELAGRIFALLVCGTALLVLLRALRRIYPPETPLRPRPTRMAQAVATLTAPNVSTTSSLTPRSSILAAFE